MTRTKAHPQDQLAKSACDMLCPCKVWDSNMGTIRNLWRWARWRLTERSTEPVIIGFDTKHITNDEMLDQALLVDSPSKGLSPRASRVIAALSIWLGFGLVLALIGAGFSAIPAIASESDKTVLDGFLFGGMLGLSFGLVALVLTLPATN